MRRRVVLGSSPSPSALHELLRALDRHIAKAIRVSKIELECDPRTAKERIKRAKRFDQKRREYRHLLKSRKAV